MPVAPTPGMARVIVGVFDDADPAHAAVRALIAAGVSTEAISLLGRRARGETDEAAIEDTSGVATGAGTGAVLGGLLGGIGALAIPGIGPIVALGPLAAALVGAGVGAAAGGIIGALVDIGVSQEAATRYAEAVRRGGTLVTVHAEGGLAERAMDILDRHGAIDIDARAETWGHEGWTTDDVRRERDRVRREVAAAAEDFRRHHATALRAGGPYEAYEAAYQFGHECALNPRYGHATWDVFEPEACRQWEERAPGTWDDVRDAIRYGWERVRARQAA